MKHISTAQHEILIQIFTVLNFVQFLRLNRQFCGGYNYIYRFNLKEFVTHILSYYVYIYCLQVRKSILIRYLLHTF